MKDAILELALAANLELALAANLEMLFMMQLLEGKTDIASNALHYSELKYIHEWATKLLDLSPAYKGNKVMIRFKKSLDLAMEYYRHRKEIKDDIRAWANEGNQYEGHFHHIEQVVMEGEYPHGAFSADDAADVLWTLTQYRDDTFTRARAGKTFMALKRILDDLIYKGQMRLVKSQKEQL